MKKTGLFLCLLATAVCAMAQRVVNYRDQQYLTIQRPLVGYCDAEGTHLNICPQRTVAYYGLDDPVRIYGIAFGITDLDADTDLVTYVIHNDIDTLLAVHTTELIHPIKRMRMSIPIDYDVYSPRIFADVNEEDCQEYPELNVFLCPPAIPLDTIGLFEIYFNQPVIISDTTRLACTAPPGAGEHYPIFYFSQTFRTDTSHVPVENVHPQYYSTDLFHETPLGIVMPILTPYEADTTGVDENDTLSASQPQPTVQATIAPNPSAGYADVHCSELIEHVEVNDMGGRTLLQLSPRAMRCRLELQPLAAGTYMVHIATARGTVQRKLVVKR